MVGIAAVGLMLVAPAAPGARSRRFSVPKADRFKAPEFARVVYQVGRSSRAPVRQAGRNERPDRGAIRGLYEECGLTVPDRVLKAVRDAACATDWSMCSPTCGCSWRISRALRGPRSHVRRDQRLQARDRAGVSARQPAGEHLRVHRHGLRRSASNSKASARRSGCSTRWSTRPRLGHYAADRLARHGAAAGGGTAPAGIPGASSA